MIANPKIIFLSVTTNQQKIASICLHIQQHFIKNEAVMIWVSNDLAMQYLDDLLWKFPSDSFLPHVVSNIESREKIIISSVQKNLNQAKVLVNLSSTPCLNVEQFEYIYELYDETHPDKLHQSKQRHQAYLERNFSLISNGAFSSQ